MSRAVLVKCTVCDGTGTIWGRAECTCCKGSGAVAPLPDVIGLPGRSCRVVVCRRGHEEARDAKAPCTACERTTSDLRIRLKEAATNYAAALLMSHADADVVTTAFARLEEASIIHARWKDGR